MFFARLKVVVRTLRFRLMLWNMGIILVTAGAMLVGLREGIRRTLMHELDQRLTEDLTEIDLGLIDLHASPSELKRAADSHDSEAAEGLFAELDRKAQGHVHHGWFVQLRDGRGDVLWASENTPTIAFSLPAVDDIAPTTRDGYRLAQRQIGGAGRQPLVVRVGGSTESIQEDIDRIDRLAMLAAALALIAAPLGGYWLAGRVVRLLSVIISTASRLRPRQLDERLPIRNTGDELDQMAMTVNGLLDRIADYISQRHDFIANSAHELRTPLAAIRSTVEVALNSDRSREEYQELLGAVIDECSSLETLVNQLLLLSESETDRLEIHEEPVDWSDVVTRSCEMFRGVAESRGLELRLNIAQGVMVEGKRPHLRQVMNNLLDNAVKFTPAGSVSVELVVEKARSRAVLRVRDSGVGIPAEDLGRVFERFFRGDRSRTRGGDIRGTGLGLSICDTVVRAHGGELSIASELHAGTELTMILPLVGIVAGRDDAGGGAGLAEASPRPRSVPIT